MLWSLRCLAIKEAVKRWLKKRIKKLRVVNRAHRYRGSRLRILARAGLARASFWHSKWMQPSQPLLIHPCARSKGSPRCHQWLSSPKPKSQWGPLTTQFLQSRRWKILSNSTTELRLIIWANWLKTCSQCLKLWSHVCNLRQEKSPSLVRPIKNEI